MTTDEQIAALPRRQVLCGIMATAILGATAACSGSQEETPSGGSTTGGATTAPAQPGGTTPAQPGGNALASAAQVPVGGGTIVNGPDGTPIVIVQPTAGEFKAYDARCTHMGTTVDAPQNGVMTCPNHGSRFNATDGSVANGPAGSPLKSVNIAVNGDSITLA
jgi:cytochrome b6-f complex iron-sulfur subunit